MCRVCDGISAAGLIDGARIVRRHGRHSARLYRTGRGRPQPPIRCSKPESVGAPYGLADPPRYKPALQSIVVAFDVAEHAHMRNDPERCPYDQRSADDVRSACDRLGPQLGGGEGVPLTDLEEREVRLPDCER